MTARRKTPLEQEDITPHMCSPEMRLQILGQVPFFAGLPEAEIQAINRSFREQGFEPDEMLYFTGDPAERLYVVAAGKVKLIQHSDRGKDILLDLLSPGEFFGSLSPLSGETYTETAQAQTTVCALEVGKDEFQKILRDHPRVALVVLELVSQRLKAAQEMVRQISAYPVEHRIASTLLRLAEKFGVQQELGGQKKLAWLIQAPLSRQDLAGMTGATPETVSRVMSQFQKDGLIDTGRQWVAIMDRAGLESLIKLAFE